tara:strand:- start:1870 stop:2322 length:453 start_codon:yes stop_codon:yes gene_type:complete
MNCSLREIDKTNYMQACELKVSKQQEYLLAPNMLSIVEAAYHDNYVVRGIYRDELLVGFFMWVHETCSKTSIWRFMVDARYQGNGIGRLALDLALEEIQMKNGLKEIEIRYNPDNPVAQRFYSSFGFVDTAMDEEHGDMLAVIRLPKGSD